MRIILTGPALYANEGNHLPRQARLIAPSLISWINIRVWSERGRPPQEESAEWEDVGLD